MVQWFDHNGEKIPRNWKRRTQLFIRHLCWFLKYEVRCFTWDIEDLQFLIVIISKRIEMTILYALIDIIKENDISIQKLNNLAIIKIEKII